MEQLKKQEQVREHVEKILSNTFNELKRVYNCHREGNFEQKDWRELPKSRIIFPKYNDQDEKDKGKAGNTRISEQELRFVFVEQLYAYCKENWNILYSVETPTDKKYIFSSKDKTDKTVPQQKDSGRSASTDLTIHNLEGKRICQIEFKAHNPDLSCYLKDFLKLNKEAQNDCERFFVQIVSNDQVKKKITARLNDREIKEYTHQEDYKLEQIHYHLYSLASGTLYVAIKNNDGMIDFEAQ